MTWDIRVYMCNPLCYILSLEYVHKVGWLCCENNVFHILPTPVNVLLQYVHVLAVNLTGYYASILHARIVIFVSRPRMSVIMKDYLL